MAFKWLNFIKVPTRVSSDKSNLPASTEFVHNILGAVEPLDEYSYFDPDAPPASPSALDDEFETLKAIWTDVYLSSLTSSDTNVSAPGCWFASHSMGNANIASRLQAIPAGDFVIFTKARQAVSGQGNAGLGLVLSTTNTSGSGSQVVLMEGQFNSGASIVQIFPWTNFNTVGTQVTYSKPADYAYLRIRRVGTTYYFGWSEDGKTWVEYTYAIGITPLYFGIFVYSATSGTVASTSFEFFRYVASGTATLGGTRKVGGFLAGGGADTFSIFDPDAPSLAPTVQDDDFDDGTTLNAKWTPVYFNRLSSYSHNVDAKSCLKLSGGFGDRTVAAALQPLPSGDFTIVTKLAFTSKGGTATSPDGGANLILSTTNAAGTGSQILGYSAFVGSYPGWVGVQGWTNFNTIGSSVLSNYYSIQPRYLAFRRVGSVYSFGFSQDGKAWEWSTIVPGFTPLYFGVGINVKQTVNATASFEFIRYFPSGTALNGRMRTLGVGPRGPVGDGGSAGFDVARAYRSTAYTAGSTSWLKLGLDAVSFDSNSIYDTGNTRFVPKKAGYYLCNMRVQVSAYCSLTLAVAKNGTIGARCSPETYGNSYAVNGMTVVYCNGVDDYLEMYSYIDAGKSLTTGENQCYMEVIGPFQGASGESTSYPITQSAHGFSVLTPIYFNITTNLWTKAQANSRDTLATHVVVAVTDANSFVAGQVGVFNLPNHSYAKGYWSTAADVAGTVTQNDVKYSNPIFFVVDANTVFLPNYRPSTSESMFGLSEQVQITEAATLLASAIGRLHDCSGTTTDYTVTLPSPVGLGGKYIGFCGNPALTQTVTLDATAAFTINGERYLTLKANEVAILRSNGTEWIWMAGRSGSGGSGTGSLPSRTSVSCTTASIAPQAVWTGAITMPAASADIYRVTTNYPAWVRLYNTAEARTADATRVMNVRSEPGCDVVADNITTSSKLSISQSPVEVFHNEDDPRTGTCYVSVKNLDSVAREITLSVQCLQKEA